MLTSRVLFVIAAPVWAACGLELLVAEDGSDATGAVDASASSSSGSGSSSSSAGSSGVPLDASPDDASLANDAAADGDAPPLSLVCTPKAMAGAFCGAASSVSCMGASSDNPPWIPGGDQGVGSAYFPTTDTAPFNLGVKVRFARVDSDDRHGVVAVFFGGDSTSNASLCTRLESLVAGEAAVLYWRKETGAPTSTRIVLPGEGCGDKAFEHPYRGDDGERGLGIVFDGAQLTVSGTGLSEPVSKPVALSPQLRVGVVGQRYGGDGPPVRILQVALTCP